MVLKAEKSMKRIRTNEPVFFKMSICKLVWVQMALRVFHELVEDDTFKTRHYNRCQSNQTIIV